MSSSKATYRWLIKQSVNAKFWLILSIFLGFFSALLMIAQSFVLAKIITLSTSSHLLLFFLCIIGIRSMIIYIRETVSFRVSQNIKNTTRQSIFKHVMQFSPTQLSKIKTGALITNLIEQVEALNDFFSDYLPQMFLVILIPILILILIFMQNWIAGTILLITAPLIPLFMALIGMKTETLNQRSFQGLSRMSGYFLDLLQGLTTLSLFNRATDQIENVYTISNNYRLKTMVILKIAFLSSGVLELFSTISIALVAVYLGLGLLGLIHAGFHGANISLLHALFILLLVPEFFMPLRQLGVFYHARSEAIGAANEILKVLNRPIPETKVFNTNFKLPNQFNIIFNQVSFSYQKNNTLLKKLNLKISSGACTVITGQSGSGKTTILQLLAKIIFPNTGEIMIDQTQLSNLSTDQWQSNIAFLTQHPYLFQGSIIDNIQLGKSHATALNIKNAAEKTGVFEFCHTLSKQLNTQIGENGLGLSGGQIQRIALARMYLRNSPIILLDEPTSHLDENNVKIILNLLTEWKKNKTIIIATHDEKIIKQADDIYNL